MKTIRFFSAIAFPFATAITVMAQQPPAAPGGAPGAPAAPAVPQAKIEMGAMVYLTTGQPQRGFVQDTNQQGILYSLVERAPGQMVPWASVRGVIFEESDEVMREARAAFTQGQLDIAVDAMGAIADRYANMAWIPNSFATEARYYQLEALRQLGRWAEMAPLLQTPTAQAIPTKLSAYYQPQFKLNLLWAQYGAGQGEGIKAAVSALEQPVTGQAKLLPTPSFKEMPLRELVQITFFRAKMYESAGKLDQALADYYRVFSLSFGNSAHLGVEAMKSALAIQAKDPGVAAGKPTPLRQIQSLAYYFKTAIGQGQIDPALQSFAVKPAIPRPAPPKEEPKPAEGAPAAAPGAPAAPPAKAGEAPKAATPAPAKAAEPAKETPAAPAKGAEAPKAPAK
jgi:tetratricopeptide (TPR) repeat protein